MLPVFVKSGSSSEFRRQKKANVKCQKMIIYQQGDFIYQLPLFLLFDFGLFSHCRLKSIDESIIPGAGFSTKKEDGCQINAEMVIFR
jgi:hypothetical protein